MTRKFIDENARGREVRDSSRDDEMKAATTEDGVQVPLLLDEEKNPV